MASHLSTNNATTQPKRIHTRRHALGTNSTSERAMKCVPMIARFKDKRRLVMSTGRHCLCILLVFSQPTLIDRLTRLKESRSGTHDVSASIGFWSQRTPFFERQSRFCVKGHGHKRSGQR